MSQEKITKIHEASLFILEDIGIKLEGEKVLNLLTEKGCRLNDSGMVCFPPNLVEIALETVPKSIVLYNLCGEQEIVLSEKKEQHYGTHADQLEILDPFTGSYRKFLRADTKLMCKLSNYLPNLDFILSVGLATDVHPLLQSQMAFIDTVKYSQLPINFSTNDLQGLTDIISIAATLAGSLIKLQEKPFIFYYCEPIPPLIHPLDSIEKLSLAAENKIPVVYMPYSMIGGTSVMSFSGTLAQCNADVLAGLVITQVVNEGAPFIYGAMPSVFDMKTTIGSYGAPEFHMMVKASSEMASFYGLPFYGTAGCTDAAFFDQQASAELTMELFSTLLSDADLVHDIGIIDHCNAISPEMVVFADEMINCLRAYLEGVNIADLAEAIEVIEKVGPGGHFLDQGHTVNNFKKIWYPGLLNRKMSKGAASDLEEKIRYVISRASNNEDENQYNQILWSELERFEEILFKRIS